VRLLGVAFAASNRRRALPRRKAFQQVSGSHSLLPSGMKNRRHRLQGNPSAGIGFVTSE